MTDNTLDKEIAEIFEEYYTSSSMHRLDTAKSKLKSLMADREKKLIDKLLDKKILLLSESNYPDREYIQVEAVPIEALRQRAKEWEKR